MTQLNTQRGDGTIRVDNGSATVRHIWAARMSVPTSQYILGEVLNWGGGPSAGIVTSYDTISRVLKFYRTSGADAIVVGTVITGLDSTGTASINSFEQGSPPAWDTKLVLNDLFAVQGRATSYEVSVTINAEDFDLKTNYQEADQDEAFWILTNNFTPVFGFPVANYGDNELALLMGRLAIEVEQRIEQMELIEQDKGTPGATAVNIAWGLGHNATMVLDRDHTFTFSPPLGPTMLTLKLVQDGTGGWRVTSWPGTVIWADGNPSALKIGVDEIDVFRLYYDGTNYFATNYFAT